MCAVGAWVGGGCVTRSEQSTRPAPVQMPVSDPRPVSASWSTWPHVAQAKCHKKAPDCKRVMLPAHDSGLPAASSSPISGSQGDTAAVFCICETPSWESGCPGSLLIRFVRGHGVTRRGTASRWAGRIQSTLTFSLKGTSRACAIPSGLWPTWHVRRLADPSSRF